MLVVRPLTIIEDRVLRRQTRGVRVEPGIDMFGFDRNDAAIVSRRSHLGRRLIGDALISLSGHRRQQVWDASALRAVPALLREARFDEEILELPAAPEGEEVVFDYAATGLTLRRHPLALLRPQLNKRNLMTAADLQELPTGRIVHYCGLVTLRQQPETANGVIFVSLEDETGVVQVICWKSIREKQRKELLNSQLLEVHGTWQRQGVADDGSRRRGPGWWSLFMSH